MTPAPSRAQSLKSMALAAGELLDSLAGKLARDADPELRVAHESLAAELGRDIPAAEAADVLAQAVVCVAPLLPSLPATARHWLDASLADWERWAVAAATETPPVPIAGAAHRYDEFLHHYARQHRKRHGVFFTPQPIADYIVASIDAALIDDFGLPEGLGTHSAHAYRGADASRSPILLDPACGTGVFLLAVIRRLHRQLGDRFSDFVPDLLPRLRGIEILPVPALLAKVNLAVALANAGYSFLETGQIHIRCGDALLPNLKFEITTLKFRIPILLGNPPFSSLSTNTNPWIASLVRGDESVRGYLRAGEQRLGERKTWLHDDYVKFLRLAQWHVEQADRGIVAFITNHGYLDNATFRLLRHELLRVFPRIRLLNLHGGRKRGETAPNGQPDENVFGLDQGVAIGLLARSAGDEPSGVEYSELWGSRVAKLATLTRSVSEGLPGVSEGLSLRVNLLSPQAPDWRFVPAGGPVEPEYAAAWPLTKAMPVRTTAPVTARDHFVVAFTPEELCARIAEFRDLSITDDAIRDRYFTRTRSSRYPLGDTRSWKLAAARRIVAADDEWHRHIRRCLYRPFDWRYVFWHPAMIDWPRTEVTRHLEGSRFKVQSSKSSATWNLEPETWNLCLLARRQQLPGQPCTFFWIADCLALDGVIRSDNRGSESLFPLYLADDGRANFAPEFVEQVQRRIAAPPSPEDLLGYLYALFHSPAYRERYADALRADFPRVLLPGSRELFARLAEFGQALIELHLLRGEGLPGCSIDPAVEQFRVGGYIALRKWLLAPHRSAADPQYAQIAQAIARTLAIQTQIDRAIAVHGGMPAAFAGR
ncbi:MAG: type ISP restriction/modification enzyme [Pirellulaceae bacterium]